MSIILSWGRYGGFYIERGRAGRICLGRIAITWLNMEIDDLMKLAFDPKLSERERRKMWV